MPNLTPTFQGITGSNPPGTADLGSFASSMASEYSLTNGDRGPATQHDGESSSTMPSSTAAGAASSATSTVSTTFATSATPGANSGSASSNAASGTATNAASNATGGVTVTDKSCHSLSCSSALKAAVAVPIVVAALVGILLFFFVARRRRRRQGGAVVSEKKPKKPSKKWSRHLRAFSFDAELLMGGRFSSSNSVGSRDPSVRSAGNQSRNGAASAEPSLHSIEEVAPPYRDAVSHAQSPTQLRSGIPLLTGAADPIPRPVSTATAPPPYRAVAGQPTTDPLTPVSGNPFADSAPVSPIEGSPFNDPPEEEGHAAGERPALSRGSSLYQSAMTDDAAMSDAGSVRQAQVGRRVSVRDSGAMTGTGTGV